MNETILCGVCAEHTSVSNILARLEERQEVIIDEVKEQRKLLERFIALEEKARISDIKISDVDKNLEKIFERLHVAESQINSIFNISKFLAAVLTLVFSALAVYVTK